MTVYVESNFVLEIALGQEQAPAAEEILERAELREFELALPAFSLGEPLATVTHRTRNRRKLSHKFNHQLKDLRRSYAHQHDIALLEPVASVLAQIGQRETDRLNSAMDRLLATAIVIQLDLLIFRSAMRYRSHYGLSEQDAIIYAAVVSHLAHNPSDGPHFFISRDQKDFDDPGIAFELGHHGCIFVDRFDEGVQWLNQLRVR